MHLVTTVIYQDSKPTAKIREKSPDLHSPAEQERHCNLHHSRPHSLTTLLSPHHHAGLLGSRTSLFRPQYQEHSANHQKGFGVHGSVLSSHPIQSPNPHLSSSNIISSSHGGLIEGPTRTLHRHWAPLGLKTLFITCSLQGSRGQREIDNSKPPMVHRTLCPNIILRQAFTALLSSPLDSSFGALTRPVGGSLCHPCHPI